MEIPVFKDPENVWFCGLYSTTILCVKGADCQGGNTNLFTAEAKKENNLTSLQHLIATFQALLVRFLIPESRKKARHDNFLYDLRT